MFEIFYDNIDEALIISSKVFKKFGLPEKLKIPLSKIKEIKKGILIKPKFIEYYVEKGKDFLAIFANNFGIKYLYFLTKEKNSSIYTFKIEDGPVNYLIISLPNPIFNMLKLRAINKVYFK